MKQKSKFFDGTGIQDIVKNGELIENSKMATVMVSDQSDLASLEGYTAGSIAYTAGFKKMWQLDADDEWVSMI